MKNRYGFCFVFDSRGHVLVMRRSGTAKNRPDEWDLPGGVLEESEEPDVGTAREVLEETGMSLRNIELVINRKGEWGGEEHEFYYYRADAVDSNIQLSYEHSEYEWQEPIKAATMVHYRPHVFGFAEANKQI